MRLSNPKTRSETGFDHVVRSIDVITPFGKKRVKEIAAFAPGQEDALCAELSRLEDVVSSANREPEKTDRIREIFAEVKDNSFTIARSVNSILTVVELFEIKSFLLQMKAIEELLASITLPVPAEYRLLDTLPLLDILDPEKQRINTFYLYDSFSEPLASLRAKKNELELSIRRLQKGQKRRVEAEYGISMTPKFEYLVSKADRQSLEKVKTIPELILDEEDYMTATFVLKAGEEVFSYQREIEKLNEDIDVLELEVRENLSKQIGAFRHILTENCQRIGELDFTLAKAGYAIKHSCVKPVIVNEHGIEIEEGRHPLVEEALGAKGQSFCPISIRLFDGVTCITGANMGGKTVTLKLVGLCALLAQHGFFVPAVRAAIGLSSSASLLIGDSQNLQRGLSSFGSEMEELKDLLDQSKARALLLIDELASGTNPVEGLALTRALVHYLKEKPYISLITTHYDHVAMESGIRSLQVRGLADVDFEKLSREIRYASRRERIGIIGKYMDYRLFETEEEKQVPKDALNIARMLGIRDEIIQQARKYMEDRKDEK